MTIKYLPSKVLSKVAPEKVIKRLLGKNLYLNRVALAALDESGVISKKKLETMALKVIKTYRRKYGEARHEGESKSEAFDTATQDAGMLVQRVQNATVHEIAGEIQDHYRGEFYTWLPSDADEPDPQHQLNYGKTFQFGKGEMPGDRWGCRCGMDILVDETRLSL